MVSGVTTKLAAELVTELVPHAPVPPVDAAVTVKPVVPAGVDAVVLSVSVVVVVIFETVVGLNTAVAPVGGVQLIVRGAEVQTPAPVQVVVIV